MSEVMCLCSCHPNWDMEACDQCFRLHEDVPWAAEQYSYLIDSEHQIDESSEFARLRVLEFIEFLERY